jgi:hypothetical protein
MSVVCGRSEARQFDPFVRAAQRSSICWPTARTPAALELPEFWFDRRSTASRISGNCASIHCSKGAKSSRIGRTRSVLIEQSRCCPANGYYA